MKRALLLLLMVLLPLHTTWAAVACVRYSVEAPGNSSDAAAPYAQFSANTAMTPVSEKFSKSCCPGCHTFCHFAAATPSYSFLTLSQFIPSLRSTGVPATVYQSHIPEGPTRPKWASAS